MASMTGLELIDARTPPETALPAPVADRRTSVGAQTTRPLHPSHLSVRGMVSWSSRTRGGAAAGSKRRGAQRSGSQAGEVLQPFAGPALYRSPRPPTPQGLRMTALKLYEEDLLTTNSCRIVAGFTVPYKHFVNI